ncbi:hypothetical protein [Streptococcus oralis]|uniref:Uncharacterized protein n=1 Tax=Streptococcus oralis TaxID=1303 RepID=A0A4Q2FSN8_STROR|nr:hypothetical protein [Streptococcus oralis]RXX23590.1 hypothetical protein DF216_02290 [Streptococcus oralis]
MDQVELLEMYAVRLAQRLGDNQKCLEFTASRVGINDKALEGSSENYSMEIESLSRKCDKIVNILFEYHNLFVELNERLPK